MNKLTSFVIVILIGIILLPSCSSSSVNSEYEYGTESDSARYYFLKGWEEILDNGRWTESEIAYRKAIEFDPDWPLGKSMVARITRNPKEKEQLLRELQQDSRQLDPYERILLDVNKLSIAASVNRDRGIPNATEFSQNRRELAEKNFGAFARKYPEDDYFKAEYIEFLHANHGAQVALDSIEKLANGRQKKLGFYITYVASLELELGNLSKASSLLQEYKTQFPYPSYTSPLMLEAQILEAHDSLAKALELIERVVEIDSNHLIAVNYKARLSSLLKQD